MKVFKAFVVFILLIFVFALLWYFRPWSEYSPARLAAMQDPSDYAITFRSMNDFLPFRSVSYDESQVREFQSKSAPLELVIVHQSETKTLEQFLKESTTTGLLVIKDGVIRHEQYRLGADEHSLFTSWSVAKSFVATAIVLANQQSLIESLDDPAKKYAPQYSGSDFGDTSLRALLAMSSGIDFKEDYFSDDSDIIPYFFNSFVLRRDPDKLLLPFKRSRSELTDFHYISPNSHVLSAVLRGVYKKPLAEIISEQIWRPMGMEADASWLQHKPGAEGQALGYCCLNARLRDYGRFGQFYIDAVNERGKAAEVLPSTWLQSLSQAASAAHKPGQGDYAKRGYSWHFWLPEKTPGVFYASGVYGQFIWMDAASNLVIVKTSGDPNFSTRFAETESAFKAIASYFEIQ